MDKDNPKKDGDEEGENKKDFKDPAILAAVPFGGINTDLPPESAVDFRYTKDELLKLRKAPTAQKRPDYLEAAYYNQQGVWDPEQWHYNNKQAENQANAENGNDGPGDYAPLGPPGGKQRNRPSDPRERIRKEQDGIVLSPQRRSFNSGCFVPLRDTSSSTLPIRPNRAHSPLGAAGGVGGGAGGVGGGVKSDQHMTRRIGSGRILPWDYQEKTEENDFGYRSNRDRRSGGGGGGGGGPDGAGERGDRDRDERFERRSFGRDFDNGKESKHMSGRSQNSRGYSRRINNESREEEPEWFSSGPISQNDTIELRGFDDLPEKINNNKKTKPQKRLLGGNNNNANGDVGKKHHESKNKNSIKEGKEPAGGGRNSPNGNATNSQDDVGRKQSEKAGGGSKADGGNAADGKDMTKNLNKLAGDEDCFNFDAILKADSDSIPGLLSNGIESGDAAGSRFSRWFQREKSPPTNKAESRRSSLHDPDHHHIIKSLLGDPFNEPQTVSIPQPGDSESYFAPISPAANSHQAQQHEQHAQQQQQQQQQKSLNLMEMLQRGGANAASSTASGGGGGGHHHHAPAKGSKNTDAGGGPGTGKILSLEELEAKMRQGAPEKPPPNKASEEDMNAFKRLFPQMNVNGPAVSASATQPKPMSIMEMLTHSQQKDADTAARNARMAHQSITPNVHPNMSDVAFKLQQVQNQVQKHQQLELLAKLVNSGGFSAHGGSHQGVSTRVSPLPELAGRELLNRPEAQAIMQGLKRGDITPQHLYQQLANPAMQPRHRDMLHTILKMQQQQQHAQAVPPLPPPQAVATTVGVGVVSGGVGGVVVGIQAPPPSQQQQQAAAVAQSVSPNFYSAQQQLRVSPLPPNAYCVSPIMATSPNTLSVPALHQRIPSPRELQVHTQHIMQRALIKKKLEEQGENYRKKQAQQNQQRGAAGSPANKTASPTPLAFMPTSVMRKLTADKDDASKDSGKDKLPQGRPLTGLRTAPGAAVGPPGGQQQQQAPPPPQQASWNNHFVQQMKQPGRAIVKANNYQQSNQPNADYFQQQQQQRLMHQQQQQQQQQMQQKQNYYNQPPTQYQQLSQQQLRQQHQNVRAQHQQQQPATFPQPGGGGTSAAGSGGSNWMTQGQTFDNHQLNRADLSPTSNQLARWFSPDLLERARKGNVPSIPASAVAQHAMSLEEIERQTTPVGHN